MQLTRRADLARTYSAVPGLPDETQGYHSLVPLESTGSERRKFGNWYSVVYRATNASDGGVHALRRVESALVIWARRYANLSNQTQTSG
jgi:PAB-dependent poly(A)-specific ribonuclease subunit 3